MKWCLPKCISVLLLQLVIECHWFLAHFPEWFYVLSVKALHPSTNSQCLDFNPTSDSPSFFCRMLLLNTKKLFYKLREWRYLKELMHWTWHLLRLGFKAACSLRHLWGYISEQLRPFWGHQSVLLCHWVCHSWSVLFRREFLWLHWRFQVLSVKYYINNVLKMSRKRGDLQFVPSCFWFFEWKTLRFV